MVKQADLIIAGGGFAGLGLAVALKVELGGGFDVVVVDPVLGGAPSRDARASAIALSASGQPTGVTVSFSPASIGAPGSGSATMNITVASTAVAIDA